MVRDLPTLVSWGFSEQCYEPQYWTQDFDFFFYHLSSFIWMFCLHVCMCTECLPRAHKFFWNWSYRWLCTTTRAPSGNWTLVCKSNKCSWPHVIHWFRSQSDPILALPAESWKYRCVSPLCTATHPPLSETESLIDLTRLGSQQASEMFSPPLPQLWDFRQCTAAWSFLRGWQELKLRLFTQKAIYPDPSSFTQFKN